MALCAIQGMTSHVVGRQAQQPGGLDTLVRGDLLKYSRYNAETRRLLRMALRSGLEPELARAREEIQSAREVHASLITVLESEYPANLRLIYNLPPFLFVRGTLAPEDTMSVAVIGARDASADGLCEAKRLSVELTKAGLTIVSGLSLGIDTVVHESTLEEGGRTIAVLSSGILQCNPPENGPLAERITESGAVISRFWPSQAPTRYTYPNRSVVTSGIAQGTVVIEGSCPSAAQGQARQALEHGKQLFLLSSLVSSEPWARDYLKRGAIEVQTAEDVLAHLQSVEHVQKLAAAREPKARVRVPYFQPTPIAWGATTGEDRQSDGWPTASSSDETTSSAWPAGKIGEQETSASQDSTVSSFNQTSGSSWPSEEVSQETKTTPTESLVTDPRAAPSIGEPMYTYTDEDLESEVALCLSTAFSSPHCLGSLQADDTATEAEVEMIFEPRSKGGYTVYAPELPGLVTSGETLEQATVSATEALALYAENMRDHGKPIRRDIVRRRFPVPT